MRGADRLNSLPGLFRFDLCHYLGMDHEGWLEQHDRMMADFGVGMARLRESQEKTEASQQKTELALRRAIRLGVQDGLRQRKRNAEFEEKMTQLAAAQVITEEKLGRLEDQISAFVDGLQKGGNGNGRHD